MQQRTSASQLSEIPEDIICPITCCIMTDPVILMESGNTYEREAILKWVKQKKTDPLTNEAISDETIAPNRTIKRMIVSFLDKQRRHQSGYFSSHLFARFSHSRIDCSDGKK